MTNMEENKRFGLAIMFNDAYADGAMVFLKTFFMHNSWYKGDIICFYDEKYCTLSNENKTLFQSEFPNLYFLRVDSSLYEKFVEHFKDVLRHERFVVSAFTLEAFAIKYDRDGNEYDRVVYLDVDQIVRGDISLLFYNDKDIVCAPGDNIFINSLDDILIKREKKESVSGGLFSLSKKYLGESVRDEIIHFGETYDFNDLSNGMWDGTAFEMHVLNKWLLDKDVWITPSTYAYPSAIIPIEHIKSVSYDIKYEILKKSKIIHIWEDKPWILRICPDNHLSPMDLYWINVCDSLKSGVTPKPLEDFYDEHIDGVSERYQNGNLSETVEMSWLLKDDYYIW
jgi:lipopolysaccharide biosynthesis glycosyltransferase